jgi:hypothetical protein
MTGGEIPEFTSRQRPEGTHPRSIANDGSTVGERPVGWIALRLPYAIAAIEAGVRADWDGSTSPWFVWKSGSLSLGWKAILRSC